MFRHALLAFVALVGPSLVSPVAAQDWDVRREPERRLVTAFTAFDNGVNVMVQCNRGALGVFLAGLPEAPRRAETRLIGAAFGDEPATLVGWSVATDRSIAISFLPAPFARHLRQGGRFDILLNGAAEGGRNLRYRMELPASATAIDEVLTACDRPLVDPRDAELEALPQSGLPVGLNWVRRARPEFPLDTAYVRGFAVMTCITNADGSLRDCVVETEHPYNAGFGEATLRATRSARVGASDGGPVPTTRVLFQANFMVPGY